MPPSDAPAADLAWRHLRSEICCSKSDPIMATFDPSGPLAFAPPYAIDERGKLTFTLLTEPADIRAFYDAVCERVEIQDVVILSQVGGEWYSFVEGVFTAEARSSGTVSSSVTLVLLPARTGAAGVAGEFMFPYVAAVAGLAPMDPQEFDVPNRLRAAHENLVQAIRIDSRSSIAELVSDDVQAIVPRVGHTGYEVVDRAGLDDALLRLAGAFSIEAVETVRMVVGNWFVFSELDWLGRALGRPGADPAHLRTAQYVVFGDDGKVRAAMCCSSDNAR